MTPETRTETIREAIEHLDDAARLIRSLNDDRLNAYCLADLEGREAGWLGTFVRDYLEEALVPEPAAEPSGHTAECDRDNPNGPNTDPALCCDAGAAVTVAACDDFLELPPDERRVSFRRARCVRCGVYFADHSDDAVAPAEARELARLAAVR